MIFNEIFFLKGVNFFSNEQEKLWIHKTNIFDKIFVFPVFFPYLNFQYTLFVLVELGKQVYFLMGRKIIFNGNKSK